jgi:hypothetical protein
MASCGSWKIAWGKMPEIVVRKIYQILSYSRPATIIIFKAGWITPTKHFHVECAIIGPKDDWARSWGP